jgi:hypothetical protein
MTNEVVALSGLEELSGLGALCRPKPGQSPGLKGAAELKAAVWAALDSNQVPPR